MTGLGAPSADVCGDAAAYLLGSLERGEALDFRAHLSACVVCRDEVRGLAEVLQVLPMAAPQFRAPKRVRRATIRAVRSERQRGRGHGGLVTGQPPRTGRLRFARGALGVSAAVAAATLLIFLFSSGVPATREVQARVLAGSGQAALLLSGARSELIVHGLRHPAPGHIYEVWLERGNRAPRPANVLFGVPPSGDARIAIPGDLQGAGRLLVTEERDGGSPVPTSSPVVVAQLT